VVLMIWSTLVALLADLWRATGHLLLAPGGLTSSAMTALAVTMLVGALVLCLASAAWLGRVSTALPLPGRAAALREKSWLAAFLRQLDPDAAGRPRPRAPSAVPATACPG
jgi:uncharacterized protein DUF6412